LIPHEERHFAGLVATTLQIPIEFLTADDLKLFGRVEEPECWRPEPTDLAWPDSTADQLRPIAVRSRTALTGYGADPSFSSRISVHFRHLLRTRQFWRALTDAVAYLLADGRKSRLYIRQRWRILFASKTYSPRYPVWLNKDMENKLGTRERWEELQRPRAPATVIRPEAYEALLTPYWPSLFEIHDAGLTRTPIEVCHPFFDLRLVNFLLTLPVLPFCSDKALLRESARGVLPEAVRRRRKSPLVADPLIALLQRSESAWVDHFEPVPSLQQYVVRDRIPKVLAERDSWAACTNLRPLSLNFWLKQQGLM
jgi:asparagine synthase (glutamine-hydrolysing)